MEIHRKSHHMHVHACKCTVHMHVHVCMHMYNASRDMIETTCACMYMHVCVQVKLIRWGGIIKVNYYCTLYLDFLLGLGERKMDQLQMTIHTYIQYTHNNRQEKKLGLASMIPQALGLTPSTSLDRSSSEPSSDKSV